MKKEGLALAFIALFLISFSYLQFTGNAVDGPPQSNEQHSIGPSAEEQQCVYSCVAQFCDMTNQTCKTLYGPQCLNECNVEGEPEPENEEESCMQECVKVGCDLGDFSCQAQNQESCEEECGMIKEPEAKNAEEQCIRDCVKSSNNPDAQCQNSPEGEIGGRICKKCAKECEHLYEGPCLDDKVLKSKQKECETCEHCYGEPIMGDSGEGWECIISVECKDATSEFGDQPGEGPGIGQEGFVAKVGDFFKNVFGGDRENTEEQSNPETNTNSGTIPESDETEVIATIE